MRDQDKKLLTIMEVASYLNIKVKTLYAMVSANEIPHYRIGRLIRFRKDEIDTWIETKKVVQVDPEQAAKRIIKSIRTPSVDIDRVVKKTIDQIKGGSYTFDNGKPDRIKDLKKEVHNGSL